MCCLVVILHARVEPTHRNTNLLNISTNHLVHRSNPICSIKVYQNIRIGKYQYIEHHSSRYKEYIGRLRSQHICGLDRCRNIFCCKKNISVSVLRGTNCNVYQVFFFLNLSFQKNIKKEFFPKNVPDLER